MARRNHPPKGDGTSYSVLSEKVRFFEPSRYGASCAEVHEMELKPVAYTEFCATAIVLS